MACHITTRAININVFHGVYTSCTVSSTSMCFRMWHEYNHYHNHRCISGHGSVMLQTMIVSRHTLKRIDVFQPRHQIANIGGDIDVATPCFYCVSRARSTVKRGRRYTHHETHRCISNGSSMRFTWFMCVSGGSTGSVENIDIT